MRNWWSASFTISLERSICSSTVSVTPTGLVWALARGFSPIWFVGQPLALAAVEASAVMPARRTAADTLRHAMLMFMLILLQRVWLGPGGAAAAGETWPIAVTRTNAVRDWIR